ncbi:MAG: helix-turn-helix domain-containing protein [Actinomycetota bacterium]
MKAGSHAVVQSHGHDCGVCGAQLDPAHLESDPEGARCAFCGALQAEAAGRADLSLLSGDDGASPHDHLGSLHAARVARGETLEQAAHFTNIRLSYLRRLESGDIEAFEPYPGRVYARFFVRDYAEHLGVDPEPLLRRFEQEAAPAIEPMPPSIPQPTVRRRRWAIGALILLIALLAADARFQLASERRGIAPAAAVGRRTPAVVGRAGTHHRTPAPPEGVGVVLHTTGRCWVDATVDGKSALQETLAPGRTVRLRGAHEVDLRLGNAGAVTVEVNGRPVATGGPGQVVVLTFAWQGGRLVRS